MIFCVMVLKTSMLLSMTMVCGRCSADAGTPVSIGCSLYVRIVSMVEVGFYWVRACRGDHSNQFLRVFVLIGLGNVVFLGFNSGNLCRVCSLAWSVHMFLLLQGRVCLSVTGRDKF